MTWSNLNFNMGDVLTATKMNQLYNNFSAMATGESGSPKVRLAGLQIGSATYYFASTYNEIFLQNAYFFLPIMSFNGSANFEYRCNGGIVSLPHFSLRSTNAPGISSSNPFKITLKYLQSSPPYDIGYGEIPLFMFLRLNSQGDVISASAAADPPWANNLDHRNSTFRDGRLYQSRLKSNQPKISDAQTPEQIRACLHAIKDSNCWEEVAVTQAIKNEKMDIIPHPFANIQSGEKIVLLDTSSTTGQELVTLLQQGELDAINVLTNRYINLDNEPLAVNSPRGVLTVRAHWKDTSSTNGNNPESNTQSNTESNPESNSESNTEESNTEESNPETSTESNTDNS